MRFSEDQILFCTTFISRSNFKSRKILQNKKALNSCKVDRNENTLGSGLTHSRYFFQPINYCNSIIDYDSLIDLGCGNGHFINEVLKRKKK